MSYYPLLLPVNCSTAAQKLAIVFVLIGRHSNVAVYLFVNVQWPQLRLLKENPPRSISTLLKQNFSTRRNWSNSYNPTVTEFNSKIWYACLKKKKKKEQKKRPQCNTAKRLIKLATITNDHIIKLFISDKSKLLL